MGAKQKAGALAKGRKERKREAAAKRPARDAVATGAKMGRRPLTSDEIAERDARRLAVGADVARRRLACGLSVTQLAGAAGCSEQTIRELEKGRLGVTPALLEKIKSACSAALNDEVRSGR